MSRPPDSAEDPPSIGDGVQIGMSGAAGHFQAGHLGDPEAGLNRSHGHLGLDLEPGRLEIEEIEIAPMESAEAVAQVGQVGSVQAVEEREQAVVPQAPEAGDVQRSAPAHEPRPFDEVVTVLQEV